MQLKNLLEGVGYVTVWCVLEINSPNIRLNKVLTELPSRTKYLRDGSQEGPSKKAKIALEDVSFTKDDSKGVHWSHNDALVIRARIGNMEVRRVMVDTGLRPDQLTSSLEPLHGFTSDAVIPKGRIRLPLTIGESDLQATTIADFLIIDGPSAYNVVMGRPAMNNLDLVVSTKALAIKFPTLKGTGCGVSHDLDPRDVDCNQAASPADELEDVAVSSLDVERHLQVGKGLFLEVKSQLTEFLETNLDVFAWNHEDMVGIDPRIMQHRLNVNPNHKSIRQKRRPITAERYATLKEEVDKLLASGFIREAQYPTWVENSILLVDATAGHQLLSFMDAYSGYNQIPMNPDEEEHTSFMTDWGLYCYKVANHVSDLGEAFQVLRKYQMKLNPLKCSFGVAFGKFLGFMVNERGIEANPEKIRALLDMQSPTKTKKVQSLNGQVATLSSFVSKSSDKSIPFFKVLKKANRFEWTEEWETAFQ
ncbi:uncharacterized protein LOC127799804 [Diospyros lotus]|uniref:uncharacterized protein LOC127799804 n=1 Tax=Diospyros lotus TaxID=55363 RepID=UPI002257EDC4|nr:uncharacterized protein LOC127799804 [Diospyros lotus]